jgi:hypothetical protein
MAIVLGIGAALCYGASDFLAGMISRRIHYGLVAVIGFGAASVVTFATLAVSSPLRPSPDALLWGAASGIGGGVGSLFLYRGLGRGRIAHQSY